MYRYDAPQFFANARDFRLRALAAADDQREGLRWLALNVEANIEIDIIALDTVEELRTTLASRGVVFALARVKQDLLVPPGTYGLVDRIRPDRLSPMLATVEAAYQDCEQTHPPEQASAVEPPAAPAADDTTARCGERERSLRHARSGHHLALRRVSEVRSRGI